MSEELVNHPKHYNTEGRKECWDEMVDLFGEQAVAIFDVLSAYKYHYRKGEKQGNPAEQDEAKIDTYMRHSFGTIMSAESNVDLAKKCYRTMLEVLKNG